MSEDPNSIEGFFFAIRPRSSYPWRIHGTGIFTYMKGQCLSDQCRYTIVPWILWALRKSTWNNTLTGWTSHFQFRKCWLSLLPSVGWLLVVEAEMTRMVMNPVINTWFIESQRIHGISTKFYQYWKKANSTIHAGKYSVFEYVSAKKLTFNLGFWHVWSQQKHRNLRCFDLICLVKFTSPPTAALKKHHTKTPLNSNRKRVPRVRQHIFHPKQVFLWFLWRKTFYCEFVCRKHKAINFINIMN